MLKFFPVVLAAENSLKDGVNEAYIFSYEQGLFTGSLTSAIGTAIEFFLGFAAVLAVAAIIYGGFTYITSFGDDKKVEHAKQVILAAIIGLIILGVSFAVVTTLLTFFKKP